MPTSQTEVEAQCSRKLLSLMKKKTRTINLLPCLPKGRSHRPKQNLQSKILSSKPSSLQLPSNKVSTKISGMVNSNSQLLPSTSARTVWISSHRTLPLYCLRAVWLNRSILLTRISTSLGSNNNSSSNQTHHTATLQTKTQTKPL